jgi:hypothetical protein
MFSKLKPNPGVPRDFWLAKTAALHLSTKTCSDETLQAVELQDRRIDFVSALR